jgi:hypothetical protein
MPPAKREKVVLQPEYSGLVRVQLKTVAQTWVAWTSMSCFIPDKQGEICISLGQKISVQSK